MSKIKTQQLEQLAHWISTTGGTEVVLVKGKWEVFVVKADKRHYVYHHCRPGVRDVVRFKNQSTHKKNTIARPYCWGCGTKLPLKIWSFIEYAEW